MAVVALPPSPGPFSPSDTSFTLMSGISKITVERNQKTLLELVAKPGNDVCADCKARNPRWASHNLGVFICVSCAAIHRKIGTHISKVKSLTMDAWTKEQVETMKLIGNVKSNTIYCPNELRHPPPANLVNGERDGELEQYIRSKYEFKRFIDKSAFVSSKLGPSKSASSVASSGSSRSVSTPLTSSQISQASAPKPSVVGSPSSSVPQRPSTVAAAAPRSFSQPLAASQHLPQQPIPQSTPTASTSSKPEGVWADLISLRAPSTSSFPLQYQAAQSNFSGAIASYQTPMSANVNALQPNQLAFNPYSQQMLTTPGPLSSSFSMTPPVSALPMLNTQQPYFSQMHSPASAPGTQLQSNLYQPQPLQGSLQSQAPTNHIGQTMYAAGNSQLLSAPATQAHFMSPSPIQPFSSHSPQPMMSTTPQLQPQALSTTPQPQPMMGQSSQFMPMGPDMSGQLPLQQGLYSAQPQGQFGGFQGQTFPTSTFPGAQQWGAM